MPILGPDPLLREAFDVLAERLEHPQGTDKALYLRHCQAVIEDAVDQYEIDHGRAGIFRKYPREEGTTYPRTVLEEGIRTRKLPAFPRPGTQQERVAVSRS
jgi:hypothetical protein